MTLKTEYMALAAVALAVIAYKAGQRKEAGRVQTADTNIHNPGQWWNYASSWAA